MRQVVLDTETTGLDWKQGHRVIEIGCIEIVDRRRTDNSYHQYLNPERAIDPGAEQIHGLSRDFLSDKPVFSDVVAEFMTYLGDAELIIHNAPFDLGFLDNELRLHGAASLPLSRSNPVLDTLVMARQFHPGQRNSLDALCKRHGIDNSRRDLHGALLDAQLLADVYLAMTGGQAALSLGESAGDSVSRTVVEHRRINTDGLKLRELRPEAADLRAHEAQLDMLDSKSANGAVWRRLDYC